MLDPLGPVLSSTPLVRPPSRPTSVRIYDEAVRKREEMLRSTKTLIDIKTASSSASTRCLTLPLATTRSVRTATRRA